MQAMFPLFGGSNEATVTDNALGAVARMMQTADMPSFPLEQVHFKDAGVAYDARG